MESEFMKAYFKRSAARWRKDPRFSFKKKTQNFRLLLHALVIGLLVGLLGSAFRISLHYVEEFRKYIFAQAVTDGFISWVIPVLFTITAILISLWLVRKFAPETAGSGVHEIEGALDGIRAMRWKRVIPVKFIASLFSLGSGLLLGREGPTVQLGANVGKMIKDLTREATIEDNPLVSAGSAAGLACAFNAPFAGIIFVIEEMHEHFKFTFYSVAAIMIGAGSADFVVRALIGSDPVIQMTVFESPPLGTLWLFILLGVIFSGIGLLYNRGLLFFLNFFRGIQRIPLYVTGLIAALVIAITGIFYPELIGGGYDLIEELLKDSFFIYQLLLIFAARLFLSIFSYSTGAPGGIFAPIITLGLILGMIFGTVASHYYPGLIQQPGIFAVAGMAGIFAATVRAPLTGLVLAVEMTSNYELILPLIITTVSAAVFTTMMGNRPIYATLLKRTMEQSGK